MFQGTEVLFTFVSIVMRNVNFKNTEHRDTVVASVSPSVRGACGSQM